MPGIQNKRSIKVNLNKMTMRQVKKTLFLIRNNLPRATKICHALQNGTMQISLEETFSILKHTNKQERFF